MAALPERLWIEYWVPNPGVQTAVRITAAGNIFILFPIAGWILAGTTIPKEGPGHRLLMAFAAGLAGAFVSALLVFGILALKDFIEPAPQSPDFND